jgi:CHAT domain-containing protein
LGREVIKPYRYNEDGEREDEQFWCQQFALSRWLSGQGGTVEELQVGTARAIAPTQVNLGAVQEEVTFIKQLHNLRSDITVLEPFSTSQEVLDWLETGKFFMLHFACHGMFDAALPGNSAIKLSDGILRPSDIRVRFGGRRPRPLLFINACHGGRSEFSFTGLGGWAERLVTEARVAVFVGAMWEVNDGLALRFAQRFYTGLLKNNETIAEAFRYAREEIRQLAPYNSTWLAYSLYGDPQGRVNLK